MCLLIVRPHAQDLDGLDVLQNLVNQSMLDSYTSGTCAGKVTEESFAGWRGLVGINLEDIKQSLGLGF